MVSIADVPGLEVKEDFPLLRRRIDGRPIVYLDSAATSQKPRCVIDAMSAFYRHRNANVHRSVYQLAEEATAAFEDARARVAGFCGAPTQTTIFTRNATEAINLVAYAWGRQHVGRGDVILLTEVEHHSNIVPWQLLAREVGAELRYLRVADDGQIDLGDLDDELAGGRVRLVAFAHVSNVLGSVAPVEEIVARARATGAVTLVDGCQAVPHMRVDVEALGCDFYAWTGHKALGPTGIGVLHGRREVLERMPPFMAGGDMIRTVSWQDATWNELPWKFEAGTSMIAEAVGLGVAVDYLDELGMDAVHAHEGALGQRTIEQLGALPGLRLFGPRAGERGAVVSFAVDGIHPHDVAELLGRSNVCVRAGHHCAQPLMRRLGVAATTRASFGPYSTPEDVDALVAAVQDAQRAFGA